MRVAFIGGVCCLWLPACGSLLPAPEQRRPAAPVPVSSDPILASVGLFPADLVAHHLEQHPDADCRSDWRPESLRVEPVQKRPQLETIEAIAMAYEGTPYVYGGVGPRGLDCSAFVNKVYAQLGYDLPRTAREQIRVGLRIRRSALQTGDLIFFSERPSGGRISHVALFLEAGRFIHAVRGKGRVTFDRLDNSYYDVRFAGGRRVVVMPPGRYSDRAGAAKSGLVFSEPEEVAERFGATTGPCREASFGHLARWR